MTSGKGTNPAASIHGRLLHIARQRGEHFEDLLIRFGLERLLYRLSKSPAATRFVLKGALLFVLWGGDSQRPTRDIDLLGLEETSQGDLARIFRDLCTQPISEDCLEFHPDSVEASPIREDQRYGGVRIRLRATLGKARIPIRVDVCFGDAITPQPEVHDFPTILRLPAPRLSAYPRVTVVAEKTHALVDLGFANSRMKDFFDLLIMSEDYSFDGRELCQAISRTFHHRRTQIPIGIPVALTPEFADDQTKQIQWRAFVSKSDLEVSVSFLKILAKLRAFLQAPLESAHAPKGFAMKWNPRGPWKIQQ